MCKRTRTRACRSGSGLGGGKVEAGAGGSMRTRWAGPQVGCLPDCHGQLSGRLVGATGLASWGLLMHALLVAGCTAQHSVTIVFAWASASAASKENSAGN